MGVPLAGRSIRAKPPVHPFAGGGVRRLGRHLVGNARNYTKYVVIIWWKLEEKQEVAVARSVEGCLSFGS